MSEPRLGPDDIAASATAQGVTLVGWGTVVDAGGGDRDTAAFVSEHERLHVNLNSSTSYGILLRACAVHAPRHLGSAVELCRTTHETYATYLGIWVALEDPQRVLAAFPDYLRYFALGERLAREFRAGGIAARNAVSAAARAAMHMSLPGIAAQLGDGELAIPEDAGPDRRFAVLCEAAPPVRELLGAFPTAWLDEPIEKTLEEEHGLSKDEMGKLNQVLFERYADFLRKEGLPTLDWDAHQQDDDIRAIVGLGGAGLEFPVELKLGPEEGDPQSPRHFNLRLFDGERWIQRGTPDAAWAMHLLDVPEEQRPGALGPSHLLGTIDGERDVFVVVRPLRLLLAQYEFDAESRRILAAAATNGVITAVRRTVTIGDVPTALFALLASASELERLRALGTEVGILSSVSVACAAVVEWSDYWLPALHAFSKIVLDVDIALSHWLEIVEAERNPSPLSFECQGAATDRSETPTQILAVEFGGPERIDVRQLVCGSPTAITSLSYALGRSPHVRTEHDDRILPESTVWPRVIARLIEEERWFERRGFEYLGKTSGQANAN